MADEQPVEQKYVAIVAMGQSRGDFATGRLMHDGPRVCKEEVWTINSCAEVYRSDLIFMMDAMWHTPLGQRVYAAAQQSNTPIMTSRPFAHLPLLREYPLEDVIKSVGDVYFNTTVAYAFCYALHRGYTHIGLFGCDFTYPDSHWGEAGRGCLEYWMGRASARGVQITLPGSTQLMDQALKRPLYSYWETDEQPPDVPYGSGLLTIEQYRARVAAQQAPALEDGVKPGAEPMLRVVGGDK